MPHPIAVRRLGGVDFKTSPTPPPLEVVQQIPPQCAILPHALSMRHAAWTGHAARKLLPRGFGRSDRAISRPQIKPVVWLPDMAYMSSKPRLSKEAPYDVYEILQESARRMPGVVEPVAAPPPRQFDPTLPREVAPRASAHPQTRIMLRRKFVKSLTLAFGGMIASVLAIGTIGESESGFVEIFICTLIVAWFWGVVAFWINVLTAIKLRRHPWVEWPAASVELEMAGPMITPNGTWAMQLFEPSRREVYTLTPWTTIFHWQEFENAQTLWFCGDPDRYGVVSPIDGGNPTFASRTIFNRKSLKRRALEANRLDPESWHDGS